MKVENLVFFYNVRHTYPDPKDPRTQLEVDFDDPETTKWQIKHLESCGYKVIPVEANEKAYLTLYQNKNNIDLVFNVAEGIYGNDREAQIPAMLEMLQIAYTGSSPLTQALVLNKAKTKEILLANKIPTLPFQLFLTNNSKLNLRLSFPLIVKPVSEGSGAGINNKSVVNSKSELQKQINLMLKTFKHEAAMIEPFLSGPEYSVAMIGNPPRILPIVSPDHAKLPKNYLPMDSFEVKWIFEEQGNSDYLICPATIEKKLYQKIYQICLKTWKALDILDWCRIDLRLDKKDNPFVLEVNSPPGIIPPEVSTTSYFPLAARVAGIEYKQMLNMIIESALRRYNLS